jgi:hypothetical protein
LDDIRNPTTEGFVIARTYDEAVDLVNQKGCPCLVAFDHDLGLGKTGYDFAKWLLNRDQAEGGKFIPDNFDYVCHSMNIAGRFNITQLISAYMEKRK